MLSIILAFLGYSVLNVCLATQKIGLLRARERRFLGILIWLSASAGTLVSSILVFTAVTLGNASIVGAMAGAGLASLALFSHFVMKETVGKKEITGVVVIVLAAGLIGLFSEDSPRFAIHLGYLFSMLSLVTAVCCATWIVLRKNAGTAGIIIGVFSGSLGGFIPLFQKVSTSGIGKSMSLFPVSSASIGGFWGELLLMFSNPFTVIWIVLSVASMVVLQFAYKKAAVIRVIPFFSSSSIIIPVIGGVLCLGERLHIVQWVGVAIILGGLFLLTAKGRGKDGT